MTLYLFLCKSANTFFNQSINQFCPNYNNDVTDDYSAGLLCSYSIKLKVILHNEMDRLLFSTSGVYNHDVMFVINLRWINYGSQSQTHRWLFRQRHRQLVRLFDIEVRTLRLHYYTYWPADDSDCLPVRWAHFKPLFVTSTVPFSHTEQQGRAADRLAVCYGHFVSSSLLCHMLLPEP